MGEYIPSDKSLFIEIKRLIQTAKQQTAVKVNAELTLLYWNVGKRISEEILKGERAQYGKQLIENLAKDLTDQFGRGWSKRNLQQMIRFYEFFPDRQIVQTLSAQLSWSHFVQLISVNTSTKRDFYLTMSVQERWSTRTLSERIDSQLFERTAISKKPEETIIKELESLRKKEPVNQD
ncbi:DUF1016 domain-containing protein, partial [bacterium]|nr:DUF1016 domain-containing protein [bacterium]